ncbi:hypothetical protein LAZ67_20000199, partial [Cordylochernes scorpioides]
MRHYVPSCTTVKLPKLMISKFYGNFSEWLTFWNSFDAAIHQNNSLNPIDKFNYLKSHLGGTALNTVKGFALSADNYEKAIKLLKDRFGREDILISRHMNNLLSMRPLKTSSDVRTFRELFDNLSVHIRSLESLNVSIDVYGQLLCPIIIKLLPADLNLELNKELPTGYVINDLITFLERQLTAREKSFRNEIGTGNESTSKPNLVNKHPKTRFYNEKPIATASELLNSVHKSNECVFCGKDNHGSPKCDFAANISLNEKRSLMKKKGVCYKCLRPSHLSKFCRNVVRCSICNMSSHLDVMCTKLILDRGGSSKSPTVQDETLANLSTSPDVLLPTLRVTLKGNRTEKTARAIIDTGSQRSYILHSTAMEMEYEQSRREFFRHSLFGGSSTDVVEHEVYTIHLSDINNSYRCEFEALGQPLICGSIPPVCPRSLLEGSEELDVSDLMRDRIEVLIGADIAGRLLTDDQRRISSGLVAIRTKLGWIPRIPPTEVRDDISSLCVTTLLSLDLENLWKLDAIGVSDAEVEKKTQSLQAEMEEHFAHTTTRDIEGRYEVALPWVQDKEKIPSNKDLAENQLRSVSRKLEEVGDMKEYGQIFEEWMKQGIIEYAREDKLDGVHYLPHRPVYKRNSQTSRIRPVFNASARKRGKLSLNDCLDKGPNLIEIIPRLLNKFRKYQVGVSSDIEKAFLQIGINEEDRDYLRFLWHTEDGRLITYRHKRVVFGITTSPYLLKATLSLHLDKAPEHLKITAEQLKSSFYVDNCLSSFQNVEETEKFVKESTELLSTACFNLRDWVSNVTDFSLMNQLNKEVNILGITWNTDRDTLTIGLEDFELIGPTTKRKVLSIASKIFDPLGVACPVTLIPKLILQETWIQKLTWDEVLPGCLVQRFWKWFSKLKHLPNIEIPRWLCFKDSYVEKTTLHIFCDASQFAYATCIFLRIEKEDRVDIQLIQARTRVAPLKKLTIPRLELLACLIGARLAANVIQDLEFEEILMGSPVWIDEKGGYTISLLEGSEELDVSDLMRDRIEVLIGADIAGRLLTDDQRRISSGLVAIRTKLGWIPRIPPTEVRDDISSLCVTTLLSLDLENLWKLDAIGVSDAEVEKKTQSLQAEMEEHFAHTTTRDIEGRYEVALPWVQDKEKIPSNKDLAENQLRSVSRKLEEVGDMKEYGQIFEEWMKQGIIEYAREDKLDGVHYLPHRPVYKRNSQTSRIRPVFNASARKRGKLSLNDCLDKGPNLIEIIPRLLNKFRKYQVGVSSDIEKAFLQIGINEEDRDYLRFLWHTEDGRLITYRHKRVVFGITTSPYLLKATLSLHLDKAPEHLKITAEQLKSSFYVDNCLSSFQNVEETEKFVKESTELLSTACFNLRDWVSNVTDFSLMNQLNKEVNILGITWNTDRDTLTIGLEDFELIGPTTKRKVLSIASKIFDPLGVACPVTLIPKLILQETWIQKLTWDEVLPGCLVQRFWKWFSKLKHLPNIEIPRWLCFKDSYVEKTTLHIFCDASQFAYATCIFLRIEKEDRVDIQLIQARTRVAPLKKLTIPRLELLACLIGARLAANVIQDLEFEEILMGSPVWIDEKGGYTILKCDPTLKNITWKFIPPGAPWWGGWWERLIGMMKQLLFRILGQTSLGYEELSTVMCDVESLMNTRPLTYLTEESEDLAPLTPSLFLHEVREVGVPDLDLIDNQTLSRKYQYIKRVREDLRERFRIEYFGFLRQETRRLKTTIPLKVGDMVLIGQESLKRLHWPLARIIQLYPGKDGLVKVAKVKTSSGDKIRPIRKLYNLEITPEIRCRDPLTERSPTQEVRLTTEEDPLTSQQEQHHIDTPNVVSSYGRPIKRPNRLDLLNFSFPSLSRRDANSKVGEMLEKKTSEAANGRPAEAATGCSGKNEETIGEEL